ncbi:MAG: LysM peptidoglycan-binding domain-containing protein [Candidatus Nanopelagicales bacterium]
MHRLRAFGVAAVAVTLLLVLTRSAPTVMRDAVDASAPGGSLDALCGVVAMVLAWALSAWLTLSVLVAAGAVLPGVIGDRLRWIATRVAPVTVRRAVTLAIGIAVVAPVASAQAAAPGPEPRYPVLDRVVVQPAPAVPVAPTIAMTPTPPVAASVEAEAVPTEGVEAATTVTVQPGDSLWRIAAAALGPDASAVEIADAWPRWYAANRETVGADPHLIRPGQQLHPPASVDSTVTAAAGSEAP